MIIIYIIGCLSALLSEFLHEWVKYIQDTDKGDDYELELGRLMIACIAVLSSWVGFTVSIFYLFAEIYDEYGDNTVLIFKSKKK